MANDADLVALLGCVDGWFKDLNPPIEQFSLELDEKNRNDKKKDDVRLRLITRTTDNWFKTLLNPPIINFNINVDDGEANNTEDTIDTNEESEECHLDELAKNLELLLDDCEQATESADIYYFPFHPNFEHSIIDPSVGHCCTIDETSTPVATSSTFGHESTQSFEMSLTHSHLNDSGSINSSSIRSNGNNSIIASHNQQSTYCDLTKMEYRSNHQQIQSPMPLDHDYLPRPKQKPLLMCNRISSIGLDKYLMATCKGQKLASVLNTGAIKRFARFSDKLRLLTCD